METGSDSIRMYLVREHLGMEGVGRMGFWFGELLGGYFCQGADGYYHLSPNEELLRYLGDDLETAVSAY